MDNLDERRFRNVDLELALIVVGAVIWFVGFVNYILL